MQSKDVIVCPACTRPMLCITASHYRKHGYQTADEFKRAFGLDSLACEAKKEKHSEDMRAKNPMSNKDHTPESLEKMRKQRKGKGLGVAGKYERTPEIREKISRGVVQAMAEGHHPKGEWVWSDKAGEEVWTRSSWERRVLKVLDLHPCVLEVEVEPFAIPYTLDGKNHLYVPDFLILTEGEIWEIWEVKPQEWMEGESDRARKNRAKLDALDDFARAKNWNGRWVGLSDIRGMEMQVGLLPWEGPGRPWVDLKNPDKRPTGDEMSC